MRLWHKQLIDVLPRQQLLSQWRECCCIARNISVNGDPNHILVNTVMDYPIEHLFTYANIVSGAMLLRGYKCDFSKFSKWYSGKEDLVDICELYSEWHNERYLLQCFYNLQEKHDRGGISCIEYSKICDRIGLLTDYSTFLIV